MVNSATSDSTIEHLRSVFSVHGLPEAIVTGFHKFRVSRLYED